MLHKTIELWKDFPMENNINFKPTIDTYILSGEKKRPAVLICPGGGYEYLSEREAEPIAVKFNNAGFHAFVLYYSTSVKHPQPLLDISRAMCIIRDNSDKWNIKSNNVAVCGFSAGGHLAASLGVHFDKEYLKIDGIEEGKNKPNALILSYPVITSGEFAHRGSFDNLIGKNPNKEVLEEMSLEKQIKSNMCPVFLWHTLEDGAVPMENSLFFVQELRKKEISFEFHLFPKGPHGMALGNEETDNGMGLFPHNAHWIELCLEWLKETFN